MIEYGERCTACRTFLYGEYLILKWHFCQFLPAVIPMEAPCAAPSAPTPTAK